MYLSVIIPPSRDMGVNMNKIILRSFVTLYSGCNYNIVEKITYEKFYNRDFNTIKYTKYYIKLTSDCEINLMYHMIPYKCEKTILPL